MNDSRTNTRIPGIFAIVLIVILAGCTTIPEHKPVSEEQRQQLWHQHQSINAQISSWSLKGKIGVKTGTKGGSATLNWSYAPADQNIELYGPFGGGRILIDASATSATLRDTEGHVINGESPEQVLYEQLGWHVPFDELEMWSRGLPGEGASNLKINGSGRLLSFNQGIWHVEYDQYRSVLKFTLPWRFTISSLPGEVEFFDDNGNYLGDELKVKVILKRWWDIKSNQ